MVSSQLHQAETGFDEILVPQDPDFAGTGLKAPSVLRLSRLAVLDGNLLIGSIGAISDERLRRVRARLAEWLAAAPVSRWYRKGNEPIILSPLIPCGSRRAGKFGSEPTLDF